MYDFHVRSTRDVCLYSKHILTNCVFLTVFPNKVDPLELLVFPTLFQCFLPLKFFSIELFESVKKIFCFFCWIILGPVGGHVLVVGLVTWVHKTHKRRAPKTQYNDLVFYSCKLHLQVMSDNLDFIKFHFFFKIWAIYGSMIAIVWSIYDFRLSIVWTIHDCRLTIVWSIYDSRLTILWSIYDNRSTIVRIIHDFRLTIVWVIQVYDFRLTIVWTLYDFLADHGKIIYEILYDLYGTMVRLWWAWSGNPGIAFFLN